MARRSPRKKAISPETINISDDEALMVAASDDDQQENVELQNTDEDEDKSDPDSGHTTNTAHKYGPFSRKKPAPKKPVPKKLAPSPGVQSAEDIIDITPPPSPSPVKASSGKKRAIVRDESDDDNGFVPSPTRDSPKKPRAKEPSTPSPSKFSKTRQVLFDTAVSDARKAAAPLPFPKGGKDKALSSKSLTREAPPTSELSDSTTFLADLEMRKVSLPELNKCQIYAPGLVDLHLKPTYKNIPKLPRMADYTPNWGTHSGEGGFYLSQVLHLYDRPDMDYILRLVTFDYDRAGNIGNLSRIDPSLLGVKDVDDYTKNVLYLHGLSSPLLCFSLVFITSDIHQQGRTFGSEPKMYVIKEISGVLPSLELERFIAVLGLAYQLPYVPNDNGRREEDLLYLNMAGNAFNFATRMISKTEYDKAVRGPQGTSSRSTSTAKRTNEKNFFATASPSKATKPSTEGRKISLPSFETVPIYDGTTRQLRIPKELGNLPRDLPRYVGTIPEHSLALVAYTVSTYGRPSGPRKNLVSPNLNIHFAVVLYEPMDDALEEQ